MMTRLLKMTRFLSALLLTVSFTGTGRAEIIDRILAVVDGAIIMQSDVTMAVRLGLVPGSTASDPIAAPLDALIERRLMLAEVDRYAPPDPPDADVDRHLADIRTRAGARFDSILTESGISVDQLRRHVRDDLRMESYLQQRRRRTAGGSARRRRDGTDCRATERNHPRLDRRFTQACECQCAAANAVIARHFQTSKYSVLPDR
jgi:hypothetical protein